jgi:hypothetical protein
METAVRIRFTVLLIGIAIGFAPAQPLNWEPARGPLSLPDNDGYELGGVVSDGYGQHSVFNYTKYTLDYRLRVYYYLFGNDGNVIWTTQLTPGGNPTVYSSITSYGGTVSIVAESHVGTAVTIYLFQSSNGGASWSTIGSFPSPAGITVDAIDVFADDNGIHIVWADRSVNQVYYKRRLPGNLGWDETKQITELSVPYGNSGKAAKVITVGNRVIVSYVGFDQSGPASLTSRDGIISGSTISWENVVLHSTQIGFVAGAQSLAQLGNDTHAMIFELSPGDLRTAVR